MNITKHTTRSVHRFQNADLIFITFEKVQKGLTHFIVWMSSK
jgi:hypothetical protein